MDIKERLLCCRAVAIGQNNSYDNSDEDNDHKNDDTSSNAPTTMVASHRGWGLLFFHFFFVSGKIGLVYQRRSRYNLLSSINPL
jgi:hypothetical protein